jgi:hypothetical protein
MKLCLARLAGRSPAYLVAVNVSTLKKRTREFIMKIIPQVMVIVYKKKQKRKRRKKRDADNQDREVTRQMLNIW